MQEFEGTKLLKGTLEGGGFSGSTSAAPGWPTKPVGRMGLAGRPKIAIVTEIDALSVGLADAARIRPPRPAGWRVRPATWRGHNTHGGVALDGGFRGQAG